MATIASLKNLVTTNETQANPADRITGAEVRQVDTAVIEELANRGIVTFLSTSDLATVDGTTESKFVFIPGTGIFFDTVTGPANGTTIFDGVGGRFWELIAGTTMNQVLLDVVDIRAYGGTPDGATNNQAALQAAKADVNPGGLIWFKNRGAGEYFFNNTDATLFDNCLLYVEPNVVLVVQQGTSIATLKSVTPFTIRWAALGGQEHTIYPEDQSPIKDCIDVENLKETIVVREAFDAALFTVEHGFTQWTDGTTLGNIPANLVINSSSQFTHTFTGAAYLRAAVADAIPGATLMASTRGSLTTGLGVLWVENSYGVAVSVDGGDFNIYKIGDPLNAVAFSRPTGYPKALTDNGSYVNYDSKYAVCGIKLSENGKEVEFLHNGVNRGGHICTLGGLPITKWGFGRYSGNGSHSWYDFVLEYHKRKAPFEDIAIQVFGDSQSVDYVGTTWVDYLQRIVNNSYGNRITQVENYAVSGHTIQQQQTIFNTTTHKGITILLAGTNNIQGQTGIAGVTSTLSSMLAALDFTNGTAGHTNGVTDPGKNRLLLVIPPMYFSQALNGGVGQASANYQLGGGYRMAMLRWAAENDVMVVDLMTALGATTAASEVMRDDIHFSDLGAAIAAKEIAKGLLALKSRMTANEVYVGNTKNAIHYVKSSSAPADAVTPAKWISVYQGGVEYKVPLYL